MKTINRRSFFGKLGGAFGLGLVSIHAAKAEIFKQSEREVVVKIDAGNLKQEIDKCMYKILEEIQIRASEERILDSIWRCDVK